MNAFPGRRRNPNPMGEKVEVPAQAVKEENVITHKIEPASKPVRGPQKMCPKCGKVKAYHFHVVKCKG